MLHLATFFLLIHRPIYWPIYLFMPFYIMIYMSVIIPFDLIEFNQHRRSIDRNILFAEPASD